MISIEVSNERNLTLPRGCFALKGIRQGIRESAAASRGRCVGNEHGESDRSGHRVLKHTGPRTCPCSGGIMMRFREGRGRQQIRFV